METTLPENSPEYQKTIKEIVESLEYWRQQPSCKIVYQESLGDLLFALGLIEDLTPEEKITLLKEVGIL